MRRILPLLLLAAVLACDRPQGSPFKVAPSVFTVPPPDTGGDAYPSRAEVLAYLDGKELPVAGRPGETVTIRKDRVRDLQVDTGGRGRGSPWRTSIKFLVTRADGQFAVNADVLHQKVQGERAFFGLEFKTVAKQ